MKTNKEEKIEIITDELKKFAKLEALTLSEGGLLLFNSLMKDIILDVDTLINKYSSLSQLEFISICADMKSKLDLARIMKKSKKNKDQAEEDLKNALLEE